MSNTENQKKILSKFEWFLLIVALGILAMVLLQNQGIHVIETVENVEITEAEKVVEETPSYSLSNSEETVSKDSKDRLKSLANYFSENRAKAKKTGQDTDFDWASLKLPEDEKAYLKKQYDSQNNRKMGTDWFDLISKSHKTYTSVKSMFNELGIDTDKIINAENATKALSNPIIANSIYQKMEEDFGIPAEKSRSFAKKRQQTLDKWAKFVEEELKN